MRSKRVRRCSPAAGTVPTSARFEATILADVTPEMDVYAEETFGPVVSLYRVDSEEGAVRLANASSYGLNFSVWTRDSSYGRALSRQLEAGTVSVNESYAAVWSSSGTSMGGVKDSGLGTRHGPHGIEKYTKPQSVVVQRLIPITGPRWLSRPRFEALVTVFLRLLRRVPGAR